MSLVLTGNFSLDTGENLTSVILRIESFRIERYTGYLITVPIFYKNSIDASQWNPNININKNMLLDGNTFEPPDHYTIKMTVPEISGDLIRNKIEKITPNLLQRFKEKNLIKISDSDIVIFDHKFTREELIQNGMTWTPGNYRGDIASDDTCAEGKGINVEIL